MNATLDLDTVIQQTVYWTLFILPFVPVLLYAAYFSYTMLTPVLVPVMNRCPRFRAARDAQPAVVESIEGWTSLKA